MKFELQNIISEIKNADPTLLYTSFYNLLGLINPPFTKFSIMPSPNYLFRVRSHTDGSGNYFFNNISDLTFRTDYLNIKKFGRCNEPFQSLFYCSNNPSLSFAEVAEIVRTTIKKDVAYHTTSVWKVNKPLLVTAIFEPDNVEVANEDLIDITKRSLEQIDLTDFPIEKNNLKELFNFIALEFTKPSSLDPKAYIFSSAVANYIFDFVGAEGEKFDGILYPTCLGVNQIRNFGLNHVFRNGLIGFGNKIEFFDAFRDKMEKDGFAYNQTERIKFKGINKITGEIDW